MAAIEMIVKRGPPGGSSLHLLLGLPVYGQVLNVRWFCLAS